MSVEEEILNGYKIIAVVGISPDPGRPSHGVAASLKENGYTVIPVNPNVKKVLGEPCYPDLASVKGQVEVVDIFRKSGDVPPIVDQAIAIGARVIWMQEGVINEKAAVKARKAGLKVVMDKCIRKELVKLQRGRG